MVSAKGDIRSDEVGRGPSVRKNGGKSTEGGFRFVRAEIKEEKKILNIPITPKHITLNNNGEMNGYIILNGKKFFHVM